MRTILLTALLFALSLLTSPAAAQLEGTIAAKPIGIAFARDFNQESTMSYATELMAQLEIGEDLMKAINTDEMKKRFEGTTPEVEKPLSGSAMYMVQSLIPSFANITFQNVKDEADALRVLKAQGKMMGGGDEAVTDNGDGTYLFQRSNSWDQPVRKNQNAEEEVERINSQNSGHQFKNSAELIEKDGKKVIKRTWTMTTYYRYSDGLLFSSEYKELWNMELPTSESLTRSTENNYDMGADAYFDRIPTAIKTLGWNMLASAAGVQMQQRDGENDEIATLRESSYQFGLNLVRAVMFDVDEAHGWVKWADDDVQTVRANLEFSTRRNAGLTLTLEEMSSAESRFGALLSDDVPAVAHICVKLFEDNDPMVNAAAAWIVHAIDNLAAGNDELSIAARDVATTLESVARERTIEAIARVAWSQESDGVILVGVQVDDNPNLLSAAFSFLEFSNRQSLVDLDFTELEGRRVIRIEIPETLTEEIRKQSGLKPTHAFIAHENRCLWLVAGTENAHHALWKAVAQCESRGLATRTALATGTLDAELWLSLPQDDPSGVAGMLTWLDANQKAFPPTPIGITPRRLQGTPTPLLQRCLDLGGDRRGTFKVLGDKGGLQISATLGEALGNYYLARMIDAQNQMMKQSRAAAAKPKSAPKPAPTTEETLERK